MIIGTIVECEARAVGHQTIKAILNDIKKSAKDKEDPSKFSDLKPALPFSTIQSESIENQERILFNKRMEQLIDNVLSHNLFTPEFRKEYVKTMNPYNRVADYDPHLAWEVLDNLFMYCYTFSMAVLDKSKSA